MKKSTNVAVLISAGFLAVIGVAIFDDVSRAGQPATDEVVGSFERELAHLPGPARPIFRTAIPEDVLYRTMNSVHWSRESDMNDPENAGQTLSIESPEVSSP